MKKALSSDAKGLGILVFLQGLEPQSSEPESDVIPLHHRKITEHLHRKK